MTDTPQRKIADDSELWQRVRNLVGTTLHTYRGHRFTIDDVMDTFVIATPASTGKSRRIPRSEIRSTFGIAPEAAQVRAVDVRKEGASEWNSAYCAAIVNAVRALS